MERWKDKNAILQIYPRSYLDTNSDGIGDLPGIREKLAYIKSSPESLGVDAIWLSPFYPSPMRDFGYDVSDYRGVDPMFGTLEDFDDLIKAAHEKDIAVMVDFVPNHTSSDHPWFQDALKGRDDPKRDYYIFHDANHDGTPPNNWLSVFGGSAWEFHEPTGQYYFHSFLPEQPDLNWENPDVQQEMEDVVRFWFDRGVDGIRVDAIRWMGKDREFRNDPENEQFQTGQDPYHIVRHIHSRFSRELDNYLRSITKVAHEYDDKIVIFEDHMDDLTPQGEQIERIYAIDPEVASPFNFQGMHIEFNALAFGNMINQYQANLPHDARPFYCFSNHDESRIATRFGKKQARLLTVLQLTLPGIPVIYYGQEIGMTDGHIPKSDVRDPFEKRVPDRGLGRDPERTPMQWTNSHNAGFSPAKDTWLPVNPNYKSINVEDEMNDPNSFLALYRTLLQLRSQFSVLRDEGEYQVDRLDDSVFSFWRLGEHEKFLTILNFTEDVQPIMFPAGGEVLVSAQNHSYDLATQNELRPLDGLLVRYSN